MTHRSPFVSSSAASSLGGARVLLTGASGFVGGHLALQGTQAGIDLHALGRTEPSIPGVSFHQADLTDREAVRTAIAAIAPDFVLHLASPGVAFGTADFLEMVQVSALGTESLLSACADLPKPPHVVVVGTGFEYARQDRPILETDPVVPSATRYGAAKAAGSAIAGGFAGLLPLSLLRPFNIYGAGDRGPRLGNVLITAAKRGEPLRASPGAQLRDFLHVDDFGSLAWQVAASIPDAATMRVCNAGSGEARPLRDYIDAIARTLCDDGISATVDYGAVPYRAGEPMIAVPDLTRLNAEFRWSPQIEFSDGVADFTRWELAR